MQRSRIVDDVRFQLPVEIYRLYLIEQAAKPQPAPVAYILERGLYGVTLDANSRPIMRVELSIRVLDGPRCREIPVLSAALAWDAVTVNGKPGGLAAKAGWLALMPDKPGVYELTATAKLGRQWADQARVALDAPRSVRTGVKFDAAGVWHVSAAGSTGLTASGSAGLTASGATRTMDGSAGLTASAPAGLTASAPAEAGGSTGLTAGTHVELAMPPTDRVDIAWTRPVILPPRPPQFEIGGAIAWNIDAGRQQISARMNVRILGGATDRLALAIPPGALRCEITGPDVREMRLSGGSAEVFLRGKVTGQTRLNISYELPNGPAGQGTGAVKPLPAPKLADGHWSGGTLVVTNTAGASELIAGNVRSLREIYEGDIPADARAILAGKPVLAYEITARDFDASVEVLDLGEFVLRESIADLAHYQVLFRPDGSVMCKVDYEIRNRTSQFLRVRLPAGSAVLSARVNDVPTALTPLAGEADVSLLPLVRSKASVKGLVSFPVQIVLLYRAAALARRGLADVPLPTIDLPIAYGWCDLYAPEGMAVSQWSGPMRSVERLSSETAIASLGYGAGELAEGYREEKRIKIAAAPAAKPKPAPKPEPARGMGVPPMSPTGVPPVRSTAILAVPARPEQGRDGPATRGQDARATGNADLYTRLETPVSIPDGGTLVLGGQHSTGEAEREMGAPILSKVPILSRQFDNRAKVVDERTLSPDKIIAPRPTTQPGHGMTEYVVGGGVSRGVVGGVVVTSGTVLSPPQPATVLPPPKLLPAGPGRGGVSDGASNLDTTVTVPSGGGTLTLNGGNTYTGAAAITGGTLMLGGQSLLAKNYYSAGKEYYEKGRYEQAAESLGNAARMAPGSVEASNAKRLLANIDVVQGKAKAASQQEKALGRQVQTEIAGQNVKLEQQQQELIEQAGVALKSGKLGEAQAAYKAAEGLGGQLLAQGAGKGEQDARLRQSRQELAQLEYRKSSQADQLRRQYEQVKSSGEVTKALAIGNALKELSAEGEEKKALTGELEKLAIASVRHSDRADRLVMAGEAEKISRPVPDPNGLYSISGRMTVNTVPAPSGSMTVPQTGSRFTRDGKRADLQDAFTEGPSRVPAGGGGKPDRTVDELPLSSSMALSDASARPTATEELNRIQDRIQNRTETETTSAPTGQPAPAGNRTGGFVWSLGVSPRDVDVLKEQAKALRSQQKYDQALETVEQVLRTDPSDKWAVNEKEALIEFSALKKDTTAFGTEETEGGKSPTALRDANTPWYEYIRGGNMNWRQITAARKGFQAQAAGETDAGAAIRDKLSREIERLSFTDIELKDVITFLREYSDANINVNWRALAAAGIEQTTKVSVDVRKITVRQALDLVLREASGSSAAAGTEQELRYGIDGGVLTIATKADLAKEPIRRAYDVRDRVAPVPDFEGPRVELRQAPAPQGGHGTAQPAQPGAGLVTRVYDVRDLAIASDGARTADDINRRAEELAANARAAIGSPQGWADGRAGRVEVDNGRLVVTAKPGEQDTVQQLLGRLREIRGPQVEISSNIAGQKARGLVKAGAGTLTLGGGISSLTANIVSYSGTTVVNAGTAVNTNGTFMDGINTNTLANMTGTPALTDIDGDGIPDAQARPGWAAEAGAATEATKAQLEDFIRRNYDWQISGAGQAGGGGGGGGTGGHGSRYGDLVYDDSAAAAVRGGQIQDSDRDSKLNRQDDREKVVERLGIALSSNIGQAVIVNSSNINITPAKASGLGIEFQQGANSLRYATVDEAQLRTLRQLEARQAPTGQDATAQAVAANPRLQNTIVGTEALLAGGQRAYVARAGEGGNTFEVAGNPIDLSHEKYIVLDAGGYLTAVKASQMQHWTQPVKQEDVGFADVPQELDVPRVGNLVRFEKTLIRPADRLTIRAEYTWKGAAK
jgi:autotransporter-associated beta strand protein